MKLFLAAILTFFLFNVYASETTEYSQKIQSKNHIQVNSFSQFHSKITSENHSNDFHEFLMDTEEEEINESHLLIPILYTLYFYNSSSTCEDKNEQSNFSKKITPSQPIYKLIEVFRI